jgi:hypothetical protein
MESHGTMTRGCLLFAHDGTLDYGSQAVLAARLVIKHLGVPASIVTDGETLSNMESRFGTLPFDQIITIPRPDVTNRRYLDDQLVDFINETRILAYDLTPYDRTLVIDTDLLIFSAELNKYWDLDQEFLICPGMLELQQNTIGPAEYEINPYSIGQLWATAIMFSRTPEVAIFFDLVKHIHDEYNYYSHLYDFDSNQYRNDYAFSIACHIMSAHGTDPWHGDLPVPLLFRESDLIFKIKDSGQVIFLMPDRAIPDNYLLARSHQQDVHVMNKPNLLDNLDRLMELAS